MPQCVVLLHFLVIVNTYRPLSAGKDVHSNLSWIEVWPGKVFRAPRRTISGNGRVFHAPGRTALGPGRVFLLLGG